MPNSDAAPTGAVFLKFFDDALGLFGRAEGNQNLVENDVVQDLEAGGGKVIGEFSRLFAVPFDHPGKSFPA